MELIDKILWTTWICIAAFLIYLIHLKYLKGWEKLILLILGLNVVAEITAAYFAASQITNGFIFNTVAPVERILTLMLYAHNYKSKNGKLLSYLGMSLVILIAFAGVFHYPSFQEFHYGTYVISGLVIAVLSYLHLRAMALEKADQSLLIFVFSLANLVYFTLMISSMSAFRLANQISDEFGSEILLINQIAYALWSIILIIGIIWKTKRQKI